MFPLDVKQIQLRFSQVILPHACSLPDEAQTSVMSDDRKESGEKPQQESEPSTLEQLCTELGHGHLNLLCRGGGWAHRQVGE